ncbi:hypothetical protein MVEN_01977800 [Mycena venus]|uniref:F-box domain-containing protein n=1 Tax=Mycena venus TaxID=2733690 RepID=A0A8H6XEF3_9AGAR|nr:hypothetical protein MVEN_01977800 [Mycena venus]
MSHEQASMTLLPKLSGPVRVYRFKQPDSGLSSLPSPIRKLPAEILAEIFAFCLPTHHCAVVHTSHAPLIFGRVCSAWRATSISTPALWSTIHFIVPPLIRGQNAVARLKGYDAIRIWLGRSGTLPLSISLEVGSTNFDDNLRSLVDILIPYRRQWKSLRLVGRTCGRLCGFGPLRPEDVPLLETLDIFEDIPDLDPEFFGFISVPPNLRHLSLRFYSCGKPMPPCRWARITSLRLECCNSFFQLDDSTLIEILERCVNLRSCRLCFPIGPRLRSNSMSTQQQMITLGHLHTLSMNADVGVNAPFNMVRVLDRFVLPSLQTLELTGTIHDGRMSVHDRAPSRVAVLDMLRAINDVTTRSSSDLRVLSLELPAGQAAALIQFLRSCPGLTRLDLHCSRWGLVQPAPLDIRAVLVALADTDSAHPLCPNLLHLRLLLR